jgi:hypothetical protein
MATADPLPQAALQSVAAQLGQFLAAPPAQTPAALAVVQQPELAESLAVCFVTAAQVEDPPKDLGVLARPSGYWHHQVRTAAGATHMARSSRQGFAGTDDMQVEQLVASPVAAKIDAAIAWVDEEHPDDDATVRLLVIPAYYVHALLMVRGEKYSAVLADQPPGFTELKERKEYPLRKFLKRLAKESPSGTLT